MKDFLPQNSFVMGKVSAGAAPAVSVAAAVPSAVAAPSLAPVRDLVFIADKNEGQGKELLEKMIQAMGRAVADVGILESSSPTWSKDVAAIRAKVIVCLGDSTQRWFLSNMKMQRGKIQDIEFQKAPMKIMFTHSLEHMLKKPATKKECWTDLQAVMKVLAQT